MRAMLDGTAVAANRKFRHGVGPRWPNTDELGKDTGARLGLACASFRASSVFEAPEADPGLLVGAVFPVGIRIPAQGASPLPEGNCPHERLEDAA